MPMSVVGLTHVSHVNVPRSTNTLLLHFPHFPSPTPASKLSTLTLLDHFHPLRVILTSLAVWIDTPAGLKHSPSETLQRTPFLSGWIARFGIPSTIVTDRGHQFESTLWSQLTSLLGTKQSRTTGPPRCILTHLNIPEEPSMTQSASHFSPLMMDLTL